jgi:hypothetical protein
MMPMHRARKTLTMEKVEIPYRTAIVGKFLLAVANAPEQIGSRLRDSR